MPGEVSNVEGSASNNLTPVAQAAATAVTTPAPAPQTGNAPQVAATGEEGQERGVDGRWKSSAQERIDELTRSKSSAEIERDYWRNLATQSAKAPAAPAPAPKEPDVKDFANYNDYVDALATFRAERIIDDRLAKRDQESTRKTAAEKAVATYNSREAAARAEIPDYDAVLSTSNLPLEQHVGQALFDSEMGPQIAYHLAKNPALLDQLNKMDPRAVDRKIGQLEVQLAKPTSSGAESGASPTPPATQAAAPAAPAVRTTNAPTPAKPLAQPGSNGPVDLSKLSMDDYVKTRKSQGAAWAR
jgi:hypothetical protein